MTPRPASAGRRLIVHAGPPKTGSTSFHHYLKRNHELLEPHLVVPNELTGVPMSPLGRASIQFSLDPVPEAEAELRRATELDPSNERFKYVYGVARQELQ